MKIVIATRNSNKLVEIKRILGNCGFEFIGVDAFEGVPEIEEDGSTFEENAAKKASITADKTGLWALADDSGLEVDYLGGAPGVYSARYSGVPVSYEKNNQKLLKELDGVSDRSARFVCVVAFCGPGCSVETVRGVCNGRIAEQRKGKRGFGYDPLFVPSGHNLTFAEMSAEEKDRISHRYSAFTAAREKWFQG